MRNKNYCFLVLLIGVLYNADANGKYKYFFDLNLMISDRFATYDLGNKVTQNENKALLPTVGIQGGRLLYLPLNIRLSIPIHFDIGSAVEKVIKDVALDDGRVVDTEKSSFFNSIGISPEIQYEFITKTKVDFFAGVGFGLHYSILSENEWDGNTRILDTPYLETYNTFCASFCSSAGLELNLTKFMGIKVSYRFRMWYPVNGTLESDIFPYEGVKYKERFISNQIGIGMLFRR